MANLEVKIHNLTFKNPVITASGTFGNGVEFDDFIDVNSLGGIVLRGTPLRHRKENNSPLMAKTFWGMLKALG